MTLVGLVLATLVLSLVISGTNALLGRSFGKSMILAFPMAAILGFTLVLLGHVLGIGALLPVGVITFVLTLLLIRKSRELPPLPNGTGLQKATGFGLEQAGGPGRQKVVNPKSDHVAPSPPKQRFRMVPTDSEGLTAMTGEPAKPKDR